LAAIGLIAELALTVVAAAYVPGNSEPDKPSAMFPWGFMVPVITDELD